jgi:hypothetical protein
MWDCSPGRATPRQRSAAVEQDILRAIAVRDETKGRAMKKLLPPDVPLGIVIVAAVAAVALRAAVRRRGPLRAAAAEPAPVTAAVADDRLQSAATAGLPRLAGQERAQPPGSPGRPADSFEKMRYVFHELHTEGHHALCEVCGN